MNIKLNKNKNPYVIIRGEKSGVFAGFMAARNGREVKLLESRRLWYWDGANSISQIAIEGVAKPDNCKFTEIVPIHEILDVIEIIPASELAYDKIKTVKIWKV